MCFSSHRKKIINPKSEIYIAKHLIEIHLMRMRKFCRKIVFLLGNHEARFYKKMLDNCPEYSDFIDDSVFKFKGVQTIKGSHPEFIVNDIMFFHGCSSKIGYHRERFNMNTVIGHSHKPYIDYKGYRNKNLFEANCGTMCDFNSEAFSYTQMSNKGWVNSFLVIDNDIVHLEVIK